MEYIALAFVVLFVAVTAVALGVVAYFRTAALGSALTAAHERIKILEAQLESLPFDVAPGRELPAPPPLTLQLPAPSRTDPTAAQGPIVPPIPQPTPTPENEPAPRANKPSDGFPLAPALPYWAVGVLAALACAMLLRSAAAEGLFGATMQIGLGYLLGFALVGLGESRRYGAMLAGAERAAPALVAAGLVCLYGVTLAAFTELNALPPAAALGVLGLVAFGALWLSIRHGPQIAALGVFGGFAAPTLIGAGGQSPHAHFSFLFAVTAATFALTTLRRWRAFAAAAAIAAAASALLWAARTHSDFGAPPAALFCIALAGLGIAYAWNEFGPRPAQGGPFLPSLTNWRPQAWIGALTVAAAGIALLRLFAYGEAGEPWAAHGLVIVFAMTLGAAFLRDGFTPLALVAAAPALAAFLFWPEPKAAAEADRLLMFGGALGLAASIGGWALLHRATWPMFGAGLAAFVPVAVLAGSFAKLSGALGAPLAWAFAGLVLCFGNALALHSLSRQGQPAGASLAFAAGAFSAIGIAGGFVLSPFWNGVGLCGAAALAAFLQRRTALPQLGWVCGAAAVLGACLLSPVITRGAWFGSHAIANAAWPGFAAAAVALFIAVRQCPEDGRHDVMRRLLAVACGAVVALGVWTELRILTTAGRIGAPYVSLTEMGGHSLLWLTAAGALAWFEIRTRLAGLIGETFVFGFALINTLLIAGLERNPWWGLHAAAVQPGATLPAIFIAYLAPAALFAAYALVRTPMRERSWIAFAAALTAAWIGVAVLLRRLLHDGRLDTPVTAAFEAYLLTGLTLVAAGLAGWRAWRTGTEHLRVAAIALATFGFAKALFIDARTLDGLMALGLQTLTLAAAGATVIVFLRFLAPRHTSRPMTSPAARDANLFPPTP